MIEGVKIKNLKVHNDIPDADQPGIQLGILMEILRADEAIFTKFGQSTMTIAYKGTMKGFHVHKKQDDLWFMATGKAMIVLHDIREGSPTKGETQTIFAGQNDYKLVIIPVGVVHGYKVLSEEPVILFYHTTQPYNASDPDERVIPLNDPAINFDWNAHG